MKAFEVTYNTPGTSGYGEIVLVESEDQVEQALSEKIKGYRIGTPTSKIHRQVQIPLSRVKISDLSITEFIKITNQ